MAKSSRSLDNTVDLKKARLAANHRTLLRRWQDQDDVFVRMCRRLQMTLDVERQLTIFGEELERVIGFNSLRYESEPGAEQLVYTQGQGGRHHCVYSLSLQGEKLGRLSVYRRTRFIEEELNLLEQLIGVLAPALRNGLAYRAALNAAMTDALTALGNKRAFTDTLDRLLPLSERHGDPLALIFCDLDHFKAINDSHGHLFGDEVLAKVALAIRGSIRGGDLAFRYGGEEFAVILPRTDGNDALIVAERICQAIRELRLIHEGAPLQITASAGVAARQPGTEDPFVLIHDADAALYAAKDAGRDCVRTCATAD